MNNYYGELPKVLGEFPIKVTESMLYLYLPIKMANSGDVRIPDRLRQFEILIQESVNSPSNTLYEDWYKSYIYITAKHMLVNPDFWGNRGGWHCDGFMTNDKNWIWYDSNPTLFNNSDFGEITQDHQTSLKEFEERANYLNNVTYPEYSLLELNPYVVHAVQPVTRYFMRTFVKISMSTEKYNLIGNSHNYLFDYKWKMYDRDAVRNHPIYAELKNSDYVPADVA